MYVSQNFKSLDKSFVVKLYVFEIVNRIEMQDYDHAEKQLNQLYKLLNDLKERESITIDLAVTHLIDQFLNTYKNRWRPLKSDIQAFIKRFQLKPESTGLINYTQWLSSKI